MARVLTKGNCVFCGAEYSKAGMSKHLEVCLTKNDLTKGESSSWAKPKPGKFFHLVVEGRGLTNYWLHLLAPAEATLEDLDSLLRNIWLECCGHLSQFEINGVRYVTAEVMGDLDDEDMDIKMKKVLRPGLQLTHEYDFGSTTELRIKVISEHEAQMKGQDIQVLARNNPPVMICSKCDQPATQLCIECLTESEDEDEAENAGLYCEAHAEEDEKHEEMFLPVVNSPRMGVCAYVG